MPTILQRLVKTFGFAEPKPEQLGQMAPTEVAPKAVSDSEFAEEYGTSGTPLVSGYLMKEKNRKLRGRGAAKIFDEMRTTDATVNASLLVGELPIRATKWYIEAAKNEDGKSETQDSDIAEFVSNALFKHLTNSWDDFMREVLTMMPFGFSVFEKVFTFMKTAQGNKIVLKKLAFRKQSTIHKREQEDKTPGVVQWLDTAAVSGLSKGKTQISIPAEKLVIFTHRREGDDYEGSSVLRSAYKHWLIKDNLYRFDGVRHERQGIGIPVIKLPKGATEGDKKDALDIVANIRGSEQTGIVLPGGEEGGWNFEYADLKGGSGTDFQKSIDHHNREILKNVLAQWLELGNTETGSRSLNDGQSQYFLMALEAVAKYICDTINKNIIKQLVDLNYDTDRYPELKFESLERLDKESLVNMITQLIDVQLLEADDTLKDYIREILDLPAEETSEGEEMDIDEGTDELPTGAEDLIDDTALDDMESQLDSLDSEGEFEEAIDDIAAKFSEIIDSYSCVYRAPASEETKSKISAALKSYRDRKGRKGVADVQGRSEKGLDAINKVIEQTKTEMKTSITSVQSSIASLMD